MQTYADYDQVWLVKSAGMVLGPFSLAELIQALKDHRISMLDEVSCPTTRWGFIRDQKQLAEIVKVLRSEDAADQVTGVTEADAFIDDLTPSPHPNRRKPSSTKVEDKDSKNQSSKKSSNNGPVPKPMQSLKPAEVKKNKSSKLKALFYFGIVATMVAVVASNYLKKENDTFPTNEIRARAQYYKSIGLYEKALSFYKNALTKQNSNVLIKYEMIPLLLVNEVNVQSAFSYINEIKAQKNISQSVQTNLFDWEALALMKLGRYKEAEEKYKIAIARESTNTNNLINQVSNHFLQDEFQEVVMEYGTLSKEISNQLLTIIAAESALQLSGDKIRNEQTLALINELNKWLDGTFDYRVETLLLLAALQSKMGLRRETELNIKKMFQYPPNNSQFYIHDLDLDTEAISWKKLMSACQNLANPRSSLTNALMTYCQAGATLPKGAYAATKAYSFTKRWEFLTQAESCISERDLVCAEANLNKILKIDPADPVALYHLAKLNMMQNKKDDARVDLEKGLSSAKNYRPLVELGEQLGVN